MHVHEIQVRNGTDGAPSRDRAPSTVRGATRVLRMLVVAAFAACHGGPPAGGAEPTAVPAEVSVKPGINADFLDPALDVARFEERFEGESREVFVQRARIAALVGARPGLRIADVGAGTGLFTRMFSPKVGDDGRVFAIEIAPKFVEHLREDAVRRRLHNVEAVLCTDQDVALPAGSVDAVFVCDTYHHFEYPRHVLASIHRALRPGGELIVVDFKRIPGQSREWILGHVRAGQDLVALEIEAAGFQKIADEPTPYLQENYAMRFRR